MRKIDSETLYRWRLDKNLTQDQAAEVLLVSVATIRKWEQKAREIPPMVGLLIERLRPSDYPKVRGSQGKRPIGVRERSGG
jgi:DNA-binding transcriptional regulator YiaG